MNNILIIGGTRFVGPKLIEYYLAKNINVTVFSRGNKYGALKQTSDNLKYIYGDRENSQDFKKVSFIEYDLVYDMCCYTADHAHNLLDAISGKFKHLVFFSTAAVYKKPTLLPLSENSELGEWPSFGDYGTRKVEAEKVYAQYIQLHNKKLTIFRPAYLLGENNYFDRENYFFSRIKNSQPILVPGNGNGLIQFAFLQDVVNAFCICPFLQQHVVEILNVASKDFISLKNFILLCEKIVGKKANLIHIDCKKYGLEEERFYDDFYPFPNLTIILETSKIRNNYGLQFETLTKGLDRIYIEWSKSWNGKTLLYERELNLLKTINSEELGQGRNSIY